MSENYFKKKGKVSGAKRGDYTEHPPNFREADNCGNCKFHNIGWGAQYYCSLHFAHDLYLGWICDDWEHD
jgi:hypothetical protein